MNDSPTGVMMRGLVQIQNTCLPRIETASQRYVTDTLHHNRVEAVRQLLANVGLTYTTEQISVILNADDCRGVV